MTRRSKTLRKSLLWRNKNFFLWTLWALSLMTLPFSARASTVINCLKVATWNNIDFASFCRSVVDVLKAKLNEHDVIDCLVPLEDGYTLGQCESVNISEQILVRDQELKRRVASGWGGERLMCAPEVFAGKSEICHNDNHKERNPSPGRLKISYVSDEVKYMGSAKDKEHFCIVGGLYGLYWGDDKERLFSSDLVECKKLVKMIGKTAEIVVSGDHICRVNGIAKAKETKPFPF